MKIFFEYFFVFFLSVFVYLQIPYLEDVGLTLIWALYTFGFIVIPFAAIVAWEELKEEHNKSFSYFKFITHYLMILLSGYILHLAGEKTLVLVMIIYSLMCLVLTYLVRKGARTWK